MKTRSELEILAETIVKAQQHCRDVISREGYYIKLHPFYNKIMVYKFITKENGRIKKKHKTFGSNSHTSKTGLLVIFQKAAQFAIDNPA